jgi:hypothetical protein
MFHVHHDLLCLENVTRMLDRADAALVPLGASPLIAAQRCHVIHHTIPQGIGAPGLCPDCLRCRDVPVPQLAQRCSQSAPSAGVGIDTKAIPDAGTDSEL